MSLKHEDIWRAIDQLAQHNKLSPSGLARKAGLSPTLFNPSKRFANKRERWPSTESIALILKATNSSLDDFIAFATNANATQLKLPLLELKKATAKKAFDAKGFPVTKAWEKIHFPMLTDPHAFMLEISGKTYEPVYPDRTRIVLSPMEHPRRGDRVGVRMTNGDIQIWELGREKADTIDLQSLTRKTTVTLARSKIEWVYRILWASQ